MDVTHKSCVCLALVKRNVPKYPDSCWRIGCDVFAKGTFELSDIMRADARRLILFPPSCRLRSGNAEEILGVVMRRDATICVAAPAFPSDSPLRSPVSLELQSTRLRGRQFRSIKFCRFKCVAHPSRFPSVPSELRARRECYRTSLKEED